MPCQGHADLDSAYQRREAEANQLASYLLMPIDGYREQVAGEPICLDLFSLENS